MALATNYVIGDWYQTPEGQNFMNASLYRGSDRRRPFGLLERPSLPPDIAPDEFEYKIFVSGRSGVGKTSLVAKLSGNPIPTTHSETPGIQTSVVYWPARVRDLNKIVMFKLQFWDAGENALKKFSHILPACKDKVDAVLFLFSFVDKSSFEDVPQQIARILQSYDNVCRIVLGTKLSQQALTEVTMKDIDDFVGHWSMPVLQLESVPGEDTRDHLPQIVPLLNHMCDKLWERDQKLVQQMESQQAILY